METSVYDASTNENDGDLSLVEEIVLREEDIELWKHLHPLLPGSKRNQVPISRRDSPSWGCYGRGRRSLSWASRRNHRRSRARLFDLVRPADRELIRFIFSQALFGEATGVYCGMMVNQGSRR
jgi:hypothetical protein